MSEVVGGLSSLGKAALPGQLARWLDQLDETGRWALLKLVTGALRIGVSARLAKTAVAALGDKAPDEVELRGIQARSVGHRRRQQTEQPHDRQYARCDNSRQTHRPSVPRDS